MPTKTMTAMPMTLVERRLAQRPISAQSLASVRTNTRLTGSRTVASTLALSAIDKSGAPGIRITAPLHGAAELRRLPGHGRARSAGRSVDLMHGDRRQRASYPDPPGPWN